MPCHFQCIIGHRLLVFTPLCLVLPSPSSCIWTWSPLSTFPSPDLFSRCFSVVLFYCSTCLAMLSSLPPSVCPIQFHLLLRSCSKIGCSLVFFHSSLLVIQSGQYMYIQNPSQAFTDQHLNPVYWSLCNCSGLRCISKTAFTLELNIFTFVALPNICEVHCLSMALKTNLTLLQLVCWVIELGRSSLK